DRFGVYLRSTRGTPPKRLLSGKEFDGVLADDVSSDGSLVLATTAGQDQLIVVSTREENPQLLPTFRVKSYSGAQFFPDGRRILFNGREEDHKLRSYVMDRAGGPPQALTDEGTWALSISGDGALAAAITPGRGISIWPVGGGPSSLVPGSQPGDRPVAWTPDR